MTCPIRHRVSWPVRRMGSWKSTNPGLGEDGWKCALNYSTPPPQNQQRAGGVEGTRFNEHGDSGLAQSTDSNYPQGNAGVPSVQDKPSGDHEGEENVE